MMMLKLGLEPPLLELVVVVVAIPVVDISMMYCRANWMDGLGWETSGGFDYGF